MLFGANFPKDLSQSTANFPAGTNCNDTSWPNFVLSHGEVRHLSPQRQQAIAKTRLGETNVESPRIDSAMEKEDQGSTESLDLDD